LKITQFIHQPPKYPTGLVTILYLIARSLSLPLGYKAEINNIRASYTLSKGDEKTPELAAFQIGRTKSITLSERSR